MPMMAEAYSAAPSGWTTDHVDITMDLDPGVVRVRSVLSVRRVDSAGRDSQLSLDGNGLDLLELRVDGDPVREEDVQVGPLGLVVNLGHRMDALVETQVDVVPGDPHKLGIAGGPGLLNTVLEPTGLRHVTYCMDDPSVRSTYTVTLVADPAVFPDVFANGRLVDETALPDGRIARTFDDPVPKPSYLVSVLAGRFATVSKTIELGPSGPVEIAVLANADSIDGAGYALETLEAVMRFDLTDGGIPYDLDRLVMAAVPRHPDATEYHGLMFFEPSILILDPSGWTDDDVVPILANVAHEYLHHTRGNRVTVASWEQLALKEGLTVLAQGDFRRSLEGPVARLDEVSYLRRVQFPEEKVLAVPSVPPHLQDARAAYNRTAYLKAAEIFAMLRRVAGIGPWQRAVEEFHRQFDLSAATVDEFVAALQLAAPERAREIAGISRWFRLVGRPGVSVSVHRQPGGIAVTAERTDDLVEADPVTIPLDLAFLNPDGTPCESEIGGVSASDHRLFLTGRHLAVDVRTRSDVVVSALRDFSAPVDLRIDHTLEELAVLVVHESDTYARWAAAQELKVRAVDAHRVGDEALARTACSALADALSQVLTRGDDPAVLARLLELPGEVALGDRTLPVDIDGIHQGVTELARLLGHALGPVLVELVERGGDQPDSTAAPDRALRSLADSAIALLLARGTVDDLDMATRIIDLGDPTRAIRTLAHALSAGHPQSEELIARSERRWTDAPRLLDRWTRAQTGARRPDTVVRVRKLAGHQRYDRTDRTKVMAVWFPFCTDNRVAFHDSSGSGYEVFVDELETLLKVNPGLVPRLVPDLLQLHRFDPARQALMRDQLARIRTFDGVDRMVLGVIDQLLDAS
jgi:aminopeptidase N